MQICRPAEILRNTSSMNAEQMSFVLNVTIAHLAIAEILPSAYFAYLSDASVSAFPFV